MAVWIGLAASVIEIVESDIAAALARTAVGVLAPIGGSFAQHAAEIRLLFEESPSEAWGSVLLGVLLGVVLRGLFRPTPGAAAAAAASVVAIGLYAWPLAAGWEPVKNASMVRHFVITPEQMEEIERLTPAPVSSPTQRSER